MSRENGSRVARVFLPRRFVGIVVDVGSGRRYWAAATGPLSAETAPSRRCATAKQRRIPRWEQEAVLVAVRRRPRRASGKAILDVANFCSTTLAFSGNQNSTQTWVREGTVSMDEERVQKRRSVLCTGLTSRNSRKPSNQFNVHLPLFNGANISFFIPVPLAFHRR